MTRLLAGVALLVAQTSIAVADISPNDISISAFNPEDAVAPVSTVEGPGVKVGEGTVLRPVLGLETGVVSNVFYEESGQEQSAGILRLIAQIGAASLGEARLNPAAAPDADDPQSNLGQFQYRADLRLSYDMMLSGDETVSDTGGLGVGAGLRGIVNPSGRFAFQFEDNFNRLIRAANFETDSNTNRDLNYLRLLLLYRPRDRSVSGFAYYQNTLDIFERDEQSFADRVMNRVGLHPMWRFLPQTQAYLDLSMGWVTALDSGAATKSDSYPLVLRAGLATLLSLKTTLNLDAGYTNGFYTQGPNFSAPIVGAQIGYRYSPLGRVTAGYSLQFEDSINANYYRDHVIRASVQHLISPLVIMVQPELHFRQYQGVNVAVPSMPGADSRDDIIFALIAGAHYNFRNWIAATLNYRFSTVQTDYVDMSGGSADDPSYVRHELLLGMRVAI